MRLQVFTAAAAVAVFLTVPGASAQEKQDPTLQALLAEVRQLRLALEQNALTLPRVQILLQRMQLQQNRVDQLSSRLQDFRSRLTDAAADDGRTAAELKDVEALLNQERDPARRLQLQQGLQMLKERLQGASVRDQQQRSQEAQIASELNSERAKLDDLERQLTTAESSLMSPASRTGR